jgi:hypothetical protein
MVAVRAGLEWLFVLVALSVAPRRYDLVCIGEQQRCFPITCEQWVASLRHDPVLDQGQRNRDVVPSESSGSQ